MDFISHPIPAVIVLLGILVFVHEFGHFIVGRFCGIAAEIFSIGFGPAIINFKRGLTQYRVSIIPLGGYVKFYGSMSTEPVPPEAKGREFFRASPFRRLLTIAAGPMANILLAVVAYFALAKTGIPYVLPEIGFVNAGGPADQAGLQPGDRVLKVDERATATWRDLETIISKSPGKRLSLSVDRDGSTIQLEVVPASENGLTETGPGTVGRIGIAAATVMPTVAIHSQESEGYKFGLRTGDVVEKVSWSTGQEANEVRDVKSWHELNRAVRAGAMNSVDGKLQLQVRGQAFPIDKSATSGEPQMSRTIVLSFSQKSDSMSSLTGAQILASLGIFDGQLIIQSVDAQNQQLRSSDVLLSIGDKKLASQFDAFKAFDSLKTDTVAVTLSRDGKVLSENLQLRKFKKDLPEGVEDGYTLPAQFAPALLSPQALFEKRSFGASIIFGVTETLDQSFFLVRVLSKMFTGNVSLSTMGGPILIAKVAGDAAKRGWQTFISTLALISINLAVVNMVPIPVLDGGQIVLILAESVRRRPVSVAVIESYQRLGFVMVMALVVLVFYNDLNRFWSRMLEGVIGSVQ